MCAGHRYHQSQEVGQELLCLGQMCRRIALFARLDTLFAIEDVFVVAWRGRERACVTLGVLTVACRSLAEPG